MASPAEGPPDMDKVETVFRHVKEVGMLAYYARCQAAEAGLKAEQAKQLAARALEEAQSVSQTAQSLTATAKMVAKLALEHIVQINALEPPVSAQKSPQRKQTQDKSKGKVGGQDMSSDAEAMHRQLEKLNISDEEYSRLLKRQDGAEGEECIPRELRHSWERIKGDVEALPSVWRQYFKMSENVEKNPEEDGSHRCRSASRRRRHSEEGEQSLDAGDDLPLNFHV